MSKTVNKFPTLILFNHLMSMFHSDVHVMNDVTCCHKVDIKY